MTEAVAEVIDCHWQQAIAVTPAAAERLASWESV